MNNSNDSHDSNDLNTNNNNNMTSKLKRNITIMSAFFVLTIFAFTGYFATIDAPESASTGMASPMENSFALTKANFNDLNIQAWAKIDENFYTLDQLNKVADKIKNQVGSDVIFTQETVDDSNFVSLTLKGKINNQDAEIVLQSIHDDVEIDESFLIINLTEKSDYQKLKSMTDMINNIFLIFNQKPEINTVLTGYYDKILAMPDKKKIIADIVKKSGGTGVEGATDNNYVSKSLFVPNMENTVTVNSNKVNMQIAVMDDEIKQKTWIYLGNPLVFSEY